MKFNNNIENKFIAATHNKNSIKLITSLKNNNNIILCNNNNNKYFLLQNYYVNM